MITTPPTDNLHKAIIQVMEKETARIIEEEAKAAAARVEERVRGMAGGIAAQVARKVSFESFGTELKITVHFPDGK